MVRLVLTVLLSLAAGCATLRYSTDGVRARTLRGPAPVFTEPVDAPYDLNPSAPSVLADVRAAVSDHVTRALLARVVAAPSSEAELDRILSDAAAAGVPEVVFLRWRGALLDGHVFELAPVGALALVPLLIAYSVPVNRHGAAAMMGLVAVDPRTREVLLQTSRVTAFRENVSRWGWGPDAILGEMARTTVEALLDDYTAAREAGFPARAHVDDLAERVLAAGVRVVDGVLRGPGFEVRLPGSAAPTAATTEVARFVLGEDASLSVRLEATDVDADDFAERTRNDLDRVWDIESSSPDGARGHRITARLADGSRAFVRTVAVGGIGYRFECWVPPTVGPATRDACLTAIGDAVVVVAGRSAD